MEVNAACQLADSDESGLKCLTPGSFMHVSADCLKVLAATVEADAELAATLSASFKAVHDECAKLTTQVRLRRLGRVSARMRPCERVHRRVAYRRRAPARS